jgi:hypothetical protein
MNDAADGDGPQPIEDPPAECKHGHPLVGDNVRLSAKGRHHPPPSRPAHGNASRYRTGSNTPLIPPDSHPQATATTPS